MKCRSAVREDLSSIQDILNHEIANGAAHFGLRPEELESIESEFETAFGRYPWHVAESEGVVLGFARASAWKSRGAYARTAEVGIYVRPEAQGRGVGRALYERFLPACRDAGLHTLLAGIRLPNPPSISLHERFGFRAVGILPQVGFKFGQWHDVGYWALVFPEAESQLPTSPTR